MKRRRARWACLLGMPLGLMLGGCPDVPSAPDGAGDAETIAREVVATSAPEATVADAALELADEAGVPEECHDPSECDDGNACTNDRCDGTLCVHSPRVGACDDGDPCTEFDACLGSACIGSALDCDDGNPCTVDSCEPARGCVHVNAPGACDDGNACTTDDMCSDGACRGTAITCQADQPCRTFACIPTQGCVATEINAGCDDGDVCTSDDWCTRGVCVGQLIDCDDHNPCTDDYCDAQSGCGHRANHAACDDGDACTVGDACSLSACVPGTPTGACCGVPCDDGDPCTADSCDGGTCAHTAWPVIPLAGLIVADFEAADALGSWELTSDNAEVVWQRDDSWAADGSWSLYLGDLADHSYDHGATRAEARTTFAVTPDVAALRVTIKAALDDQSCVYDALRIRIADGPWQSVTCGSGERSVEWPLALAAGTRAVAVDLVFETIDAERNTGQGLWLDGWTLVPVAQRQCP